MGSLDTVGAKSGDEIAPHVKACLEADWDEKDEQNAWQTVDPPFFWISTLAQNIIGCQFS